MSRASAPPPPSPLIVRALALAVSRRRERDEGKGPARPAPPCAQSAVGVDNTVRRKWDKDEYAAKAAERVRLEVRSVTFAAQSRSVHRHRTRLVQLLAAARGPAELRTRRQLCVSALPLPREAARHRQCADTCVAAARLPLRPTGGRQEEAEEDKKRAKVAANMGIVMRQPLRQEAIIQRDYDAVRPRPPPHPPCSRGRARSALSALPLAS